MYTLVIHEMLYEYGFNISDNTSYDRCIISRIKKIHVAGKSWLKLHSKLLQMTGTSVKITGTSVKMTAISVKIHTGSTHSERHYTFGREDVGGLTKFIITTER